MKEAQSAGGRATAKISRRAAIDGYYSNPNTCLQCGSIIQVLGHQRVSEVREKKFCNHACSAIYSNKGRKKENPASSPKTEADDFMGRRTKSDIFSECKNWQSARSGIRKHACNVFKKSGVPRKCFVCGYALYIEIAHIKSVSSFDGDALLKEINDISNLVALCPNHHWEFDNGILKLRAEEPPLVLHRL